MSKSNNTLPKQKECTSTPPPNKKKGKSSVYMKAKQCVLVLTVNFTGTEVKIHFKRAIFYLMWLFWGDFTRELDEIFQFHNFTLLFLQSI